MIFGLLKRFDDWLDEQTTKSRPKPESIYTPLADDEDDEQPPFDWATRLKVVKNLVEAEANGKLKTLTEDEEKRQSAFFSDVAVSGSMLIVALPEGKHSFNLNFVLTIDCFPGKPVRQKKSRYVLYDRVGHSIRSEVPWHYGDSDGRYSIVDWPVAAEDDTIRIQWTENGRIDTLTVPYGRGRALHNQIMNAIGGT